MFQVCAREKDTGREIADEKLEKLSFIVEVCV